MRQLIDLSILKTFTVKRIYNIIKVQLSIALSILLKRQVLLGFPYILTIEPTNLCNLKCPQCITGAGNLNRAKGKMTFRLYKKIIDDLKDYLCYIVLFNQGEPFLNEELIDFITYAKKYNIYIITSTNGHFFQRREMVEKLTNSGLDAIIISLDSPNSRDYNKYRQGGDFAQVIDGIKKIIATRKRSPRVFIQFLLMKHNEHQLNEIKKLAIELKVDKLLFKTLQLESREQANDYLPADPRLSRYQIINNKPVLQKSLKSSCPRLWTSSTILWDGTVVPCCFDKNGIYDFGNIMQYEHFKEIWRSQYYGKFRNHILGKRESISICNNCSQGQKVYL